MASPDEKAKKTRTRRPRPLNPSTAMLRVLRERELLELLGIGRTTLWRWRRAEGFPAPLRLGPATNAWPEHQVREWLASRPLAGSPLAEAEAGPPTTDRP